jgi:hypothetical protein
MFSLLFFRHNSTVDDLHEEMIDPVVDDHEQDQLTESEQNTTFREEKKLQQKMILFS